MMLVSIVLVAGLVLLFLLPAIGEKGEWRYRSMQRILRWGRKHGWYLPTWADGKFLFQVWLITLAMSVALCALCLWSALERVEKLEKPSGGEGSVWEDVCLEWRDANGKKHTEQMQIELFEQQLGEEEIQQVFSEVKALLETEVLGENTSKDFVCKPLYLPEKIEGYDVQISWYSENPALVNWDGQLGEEIPEEGADVLLKAQLLLQSETDAWEIHVHVVSPDRSWLESLQDSVKEMETQAAYVELPSEWDGVEITWKRDRHQLIYFTAALVVSAPVLLFWRKKQEIENQKKQERQQMLQDYPEIISKLMLLLSAGMSLRRAMEKIVADYKRYDRKREKRKAYEVLAETCRELNCGVTEKQAYENIGERCDILQYRTLSALLVQHLQKGNRGMEQILTQEVSMAQELRQQQAKIMGEQASAKLLFPMVLMLLDVFVLLIVPAWISFSI